MLEKNEIDFLNKKLCFDLQFRKDVKKNRPNNPVYYHWKAQFVVTGKYSEEDLIRKIQEEIEAGKIHFLTKKQIRYSVQDIDELSEKVLPFFEKNIKILTEQRKKDFQLWKKAILILKENKGKPLLTWKKEDFLNLINLQKDLEKIKIKRKSSKWLSVAQEFLDNLK